MMRIGYGRDNDVVGPNSSGRQGGGWARSEQIRADRNEKQYSREGNRDMQRPGKDSIKQNNLPRESGRGREAKA